MVGLLFFIMSFPFFVRLPYCRGRFFSCSCEAVSSYMKTDICRIERLNFVFLLHQRNRGCEGSNVQKDIPVYIRHRCCCLFRRVPVRRFQFPCGSHTGEDPASDTAFEGIPTRTANSPERSYMPQVSIMVLATWTAYLSMSVLLSPDACLRWTAPAQAGQALCRDA